MRWILCLAGMVGLSGCSGLSTVVGGPGRADNAAVMRALGEHLDKCDRHYQGGLGVGPSFTFTIDCKGQAGSPPPQS